MRRTLVLQQLYSTFIPGQLKSGEEENIFPFSFIDPIGKVSIKWHINSLLKIRKYVFNPEFCLMQLHTAGLLIIKKRKLLLAFSKNKQCFYLPGGKINKEETAIRALCREIKEELNIGINENDLKYYTHITAPAYGEKNDVIMEQDCFMINIPVKPVASAEISELKYFSHEEYLAEKNKAPGAVMILEQLRQDEYID